MSGRRLALVAGSGALVADAITAAREQGWTVRVMTLGHRPELAHEDPFEMRVTRPDLALREVKRFGATHVCAVGAIHFSDRDREAVADFTEKQAPSEARQSRGDSALTRLGNKLLAILGIPFIGVHELVSGLLADEGLMAGPSPDPLLMRTMRFAYDTARSAGRLDLGQAVVVSGGRVVALEDIGGTDLLLERCAAFHEQKLLGDGGGRVVLGKSSKPGQPVHIDLPAIGPVTVEGAVAAGIAAIAVEAGRTLLVERGKLCAACDAAGITLYGFRDQPDG